MENSSVVKGLVYGGLSSCVAECVTMPADVVKTRLQLDGSAATGRLYSGSEDATVKVWPMRHGRRVPHCLLRKQVAATNAMAHRDLDRQLAVLERQLHLEQRLLQFVYDGRSDVDGGGAAPAAEDSVLPDDLFPLFCQFLVG